MLSLPILSAVNPRKHPDVRLFPSLADISLMLCVSGAPSSCMQQRCESQLQCCRQSEMLAIYRNSLHMKTPTPLRERMGRWLPMKLQAGQEPHSACPSTGHKQQSQYDFSDSFIASGTPRLPLCNSCSQVVTPRQTSLLAPGCAYMNVEGCRCTTLTSIPVSQ